MPSGYGLLPPYPEDHVREVVFSLCYTDHGGSGLRLGDMNTVLGLDLDDVNWYLSRLREQRDAEADAIEEAQEQAKARRR